MKRIFRNSALSIIALAATVLSVPVRGQSEGQNNIDGPRAGATRQQASWDRNAGGGTYSRGYDNRAYDGGNNREYDGRDYVRRGYDYRSGYATGGAYVTLGYSYYDNGGYGYGETRNGRSAAIIGGSAVAGAIVRAPRVTAKMLSSVQSLAESPARLPIRQFATSATAKV